MRDEDLLDSALAQSEASFGGEYLCKDVFEMAVAHVFHICSNHPFVDGNKRTSLAVMYLFLFKNGRQLTAPKKLTYALMIDIASGKKTKPEISSFLSEHCISLKLN